MSKYNRRLQTLLLLIALICPLNTPAQQRQRQYPRIKEATRKRRATPQPMLWRAPHDIGTRNLFYGPGGRDRQPQGRLTFLEEDKSGSNPKFKVQDERGVRWKIKLGPEAQPEVVAARLLWAIGYFADENYYLPAAHIENLPRLSRGNQYVSPGGIVRGARIARDEKGNKAEGAWSWFDNPFVETREFNGLRVMMALINNWDLKTSNNTIRQREGVDGAYYVKDLGASFGRTGNSFTRSRNNLNQYVKSKFIQRVRGDRVDFVMHSRPFFLFIFDLPYYHERAKMERIAKGIPRADARWVGDLLGRLSNEQIADAFRAAGYAPSQVAAYTAKLRERIFELQRL